MRKGFNGLEALVRELGRDVLDGELFLFVNRTRKRAKVLCFDGTGLCLYTKRLDKGRFATLWREGERCELELSMAELSLFLDGCELIGRVSLKVERLTEKELAPRRSS
jgi:transposase